MTLQLRETFRCTGSKLDRQSYLYRAQSELIAADYGPNVGYICNNLANKTDRSILYLVVYDYYKSVIIALKMF